MSLMMCVSAVSSVSLWAITPTPCSTVDWSRPPNRAALRCAWNGMLLCGMGQHNSARIRYMQTCRASLTRATRLRPHSCRTVSAYSAATARLMQHASAIC